MDDSVHNINFRPMHTPRVSFMTTLENPLLCSVPLEVNVRRTVQQFHGFESRGVPTMYHLGY